MPSPMTTEEALAIIDGYTALSPDMARVRDHLVSLSDPDALTTAYMAGAEKARSEMQAEIDRLRAEVERLKPMTAVTMGVGSGGGSLFVHGDYDSIKAAQALVFRAERLAEALRHLRNHTSVNSHQIELIDAALEQEEGRG